MTKGMDAGSFGTPNRWRPLFWDGENDEQYSWERPISTYNTCFSYIGQMRSWLPDDVGGICWFGVDDTYFTCYIPIYVGNTSIPEPFTIGDINKFSRESMWWAFNFVSNFANLKYSYMIEDIRNVQSGLEKKMIAQQDSIAELAVNLSTKKRKKMLTDYSNGLGEEVHQKWLALGEALITKYNDGYVKDEKGGIKEVGYPDAWMDEMNKLEGDKFKIPEWNKNGRQKDLPY